MTMKFVRKLFFRLFYLGDPPWDTNQTPPELYEIINSNPPGRVLDLGCGTGTNVITLAQNGWQAMGVDYVSKAIHTAREKAEREGVEADFVCGDVTKLRGIEGPFDLILDIGCFLSLDQAGMESYRKWVKQLLAPDGIFMIYLFFRPQNRRSILSGSVATESDLTPFSDFLQLESRQDSSERGRYKSSWLVYRMKAE